MSSRSAVLVLAVLSMVIFARPGQAQPQVCLAIGYAPPPVSELAAGPRTAAMGGVTSTGSEVSSQIMFPNPARLGQTGASSRAAVGYFDWIGDVSVTTASGAISLDGESPVTLGAGVVHDRYSDAYPASEGCRGEGASASGLTVGAAYRATSALTWGVSVEYLEQQKPHQSAGHAVDGAEGHGLRTPYSSSIGPVGLQHAGIGLRQRIRDLHLQIDYAFAYRNEYASDHRVGVSASF